MISALVSLLRYGAAPLFIGLGLLLMSHPFLDHGAMAPQVAAFCGLTDQTLELFGYQLQGVTLNALSSMWLMYLLMGIMHLSPWLVLIDGKPKH